MNRVALLTHPACLNHANPDDHAESIGRLRSILRALDHADFAALDRMEAPRATMAQLRLAHPQTYIDRILNQPVPANGRVQLDADTWLSPGSAEAALRAAGAACAAVDAVMAGRADYAFVATRPPGHHAEPEQAMGFCLFGNAAIAARHAQNHWGLHRVAVLDFDVHHGNGTQAILETDASVFFASSHQHPCYPNTGLASETGIGNILNVPLPPGTDGPAFRRAWEDRIFPAVDRFAPELLILSAGFDAHRADPLAELELDTEDFTWLTQRAMDLAARHCQGRIVSLLEGGYNLDALADSVAAHVRGLLTHAALVPGA